MKMILSSVATTPWIKEEIAVTSRQFRSKGTVSAGKSVKITEPSDLLCDNLRIDLLKK